MSEGDFIHIFMFFRRFMYNDEIFSKEVILELPFRLTWRHFFVHNHSVGQQTKGFYVNMFGM